MAKRWFVIIVTAVTGLLLSGAPAGATVPLLADCGYTLGGVQQSCGGAAQGVPVVPGTGQNVDVSCMATSPASANVQATVVNCYIESTDKTEFHYTINQVTNGDVSTLTHTFPATTLTHNTFFLCVRGGYVDAGGVEHLPINPTCDPLQLPVGGTSVA